MLQDFEIYNSNSHFARLETRIKQKVLKIFQYTFQASIYCTKD